jgi:TolB-like protein/Tfp pilus assembly protein PilF
MARMERGVRFDCYQFDQSTGRLWSGQHEIRLTPKAAGVLAVLVGRPGELVTRRELFAALWPDAVVTDDALTSCVKDLRRALADDIRQPRFIETRHRRGYRFVAHVQTAHKGTDADASARPDDVRSIAVLPFADMSRDGDQGYLCEGVAEEIINALTHVDGLRVVARSASFQFRGAAVDVRAAGRQLGVAALLEGSVRKTGDRLRITVQLVDVANGYHRWSERFDRTLDDVFAIEDEIAEKVVASVRGDNLTQRERAALRRPQTSAEVHEFFLRGRQRMHCLRQSDLEPSREMFERAIELDGAYAPAWAGLAMLHAIIYEWWGAHPEDLDRAERASRTALDLAPQLADAHVARGRALSLTHRYDEAERFFSEALRINPNSFDAHYCYARSCFARGEVERSVQLFHGAAEVRREDFQSLVLAAQSLRMLGRTDEAQADNREGIARAERLLALNPCDGRVLSLGSLALFGEGQTERALDWSRRSLELYPDEVSVLINGACLRAKAGLMEDALELLTRVFARGCGNRDWVERDPDFRGLHDDPRFERLVTTLK